MTIEQWIKFTEDKLSRSGVSSARLDAELILAEVLGLERTFLHAHSDQLLPKTKVFHANNYLNKRAKRLPLAYIFGKKEFYGREFIITPDVLVPRPESEQIIELYKKVVQTGDSLLDIGTGSGILAVTTGLEAKKINHKITVFASDTSVKALEVAKNNAYKHKQNINFVYSDLLSDIPNTILDQITIIIANLPYVSLEWIDATQPNELHYEPSQALYAADGGLELIKKLIEQTISAPKLKYLILEADPEQHAAIINFAESYNFDLKKVADYCLLLGR